KRGYVKDMRKAAPFRAGIRGVSSVSVLFARRLHGDGSTGYSTDGRVNYLAMHGYVWRFPRSRGPTAHASATTCRCAMTSIRLVSPPASSGTLGDGPPHVSGTLAARFPAVSTFRPTSKGGNATWRWPWNPGSGF